jgi:hypothetical protein
VVLAWMKELGIVSERRGARFALRQPGFDAVRLEAITRDYTARAEGDRAKLERMMMYAQTALCRWKCCSSTSAHLGMRIAAVTATITLPRHRQRSVRGRASRRRPTASSRFTEADPGCGSADSPTRWGR